MKKSSVGVAQDLGHDGVVLRVGVVSVIVAVVGHEHIQEGHGVVVVAIQPLRQML